MKTSVVGGGDSLVVAVAVASFEEVVGVKDRIDFVAIVVDCSDDRPQLRVVEGKYPLDAGDPKCRVTENQ